MSEWTVLSSGWASEWETNRQAPVLTMPDDLQVCAVRMLCWQTSICSVVTTSIVASVQLSYHYHILAAVENGRLGAESAVTMAVVAWK